MTPAVKEQLDEMVEKIVAEFNPARIYLFGSRAWGEPNADSDIDLMVIMDVLPESPTLLARRAYRRLRGRTMPLDILFRNRDAFLEYAAHPSTLEHLIAKEGIKVYDRR